MPHVLQVAVPYDWRLPMEVMESRDGYFSRVKQEVEMQYQLSQEIKPLLVSHSYGAQVTLAFLHWVDKQNPGWVDKYLKGYVNLAGPMLGLPKSLSPLLSGTQGVQQTSILQYAMFTSLVLQHLHTA